MSKPSKPGVGGLGKPVQGHSCRSSAQADRSPPRRSLMPHCRASRGCRSRRHKTKALICQNRRGNAKATSFTLQGLPRHFFGSLPGVKRVNPGHCKECSARCATPVPTRIPKAKPPQFRWGFGCNRFGLAAACGRWHTPRYGAAPFK